MQEPRTSKIIINTIMIAISFVMIFPFLWMLSSSFKLEEHVFDFPIRYIPSEPTLENYKTVFSITDGFNFLRFFANSMYVTVTALTLQIITSMMAGYAFARLRFKGRTVLFFIYLSNLMVPVQGKILPLFLIIRSMGLVDNLWALILPSAYAAFGVFLIKQFCESIPYELSEAGKIDGLSNWGILFRIISPNLKPAIATLTIFSFIDRWNDFMMPLIFLNSRENFTLPLGIKTFMNEYAILYGKIMAGTVITLLPVIILYIFLQKYFIAGVAASGVKG